MLPAGAAMLSLPSCNGLFEGIYDEPVADTEFGFTKVEQATSSGTIYIDATSYTKWTYIDFETFSIDTTVIAEDGTETGEVMEGWDLAVHRYDTKTNGGAVIETEFSSLEEFLASGRLPDGEYVGRRVCGGCLDRGQDNGRYVADDGRDYPLRPVLVQSGTVQVAQCGHFDHAAGVYDVRQGVRADDAGRQGGGPATDQLYE